MTQLLIRTFVKDYQNKQDPAVRQRYGRLAGLVGVVCNVLLFAGKLAVGAAVRSVSVMADAFNNLSDAASSVIGFVGVKMAGKPADREHPFGHGKYEDMSGFIEGGLIIFAGIYIIFEAVKKLIFGYSMEAESMLGIYVMGFAVLTNFLVSRYLFYVAKKSDSVSLLADAEHLSTDIYSSLGVLVGLVLIKITGITLLDPIIAIVVALIILKAGFSISKETLNNLLDGSLPNEDIQTIENVLKNNKVIKGYKNIKGRKAGQYKEIELTIFFNPDMKISCCHNICDQIETDIKAALGNVSTTIHAEPATVSMEAK